MQRSMFRVAGMLALAAGSLLAQGAPPQHPAMHHGRLPHERMTQRLKERLDLTDQQVTRLDATHRKYAEKHRILADQAREIRMALRDELLRPDSARTAQLSALLDRQMQLGRTRLELAEAQQKELATFLSPIQRVKLNAAAGAMRNHMMRRRSAGGPGVAGRGMMGQGCMQMMGGQMGPGGQGMGRMGPPPADSTKRKPEN